MRSGITGARWRPIPARSTSLSIWRWKRRTSPTKRWPLIAARATGTYDRLVESDIVAFMREQADTFDLIVSSDVLTYIGNLSPLLEASVRCLRPRGRMAISAECLETAGATTGYRLAASGHYQHSKAYLEAAFAAAGLGIQAIQQGVMRREAGRDIASWIVIAGKHQLA